MVSSHLWKEKQAVRKLHYDVFSLRVAYSELRVGLLPPRERQNAVWKLRELYGAT